MRKVRVLEGSSLKTIRLDLLPKLVALAKKFSKNLDANDAMFYTFYDGSAIQLMPGSFTLLRQCCRSISKFFVCL